MPEEDKLNYEEEEIEVPEIVVKEEGEGEGEKELEQEQEKVEEKQENIGDKILEGLSKLVEKKNEPEKKEEKKLPEFDKEEFNSKYLDDPYESMNKFTGAVIAPAIREVLKSSVPDMRKFAKYIGRGDDKVKGLMEQYPEEFEKVVDGMPNKQDPEVYIKAANMVRMNHMDDIIEAERKKAVAETIKQMTEKKAHYETGNRPAPKRKQIVLTPKEKKAAERRADAIGMNFDDYVRTMYGK